MSWTFRRHPVLHHHADRSLCRPRPKQHRQSHHHHGHCSLPAHEPARAQSAACLPTLPAHLQDRPVIRIPIPPLRRAPAPAPAAGRATSAPYTTPAHIFVAMPVAQNGELKTRVKAKSRPRHHRHHTATLHQFLNQHTHPDRSRPHPPHRARHHHHQSAHPPRPVQHQ